MTTTALADELRDLASMVRRLGPDRRDPERFFMDKDDAAKRLAMLARRVEREARRVPVAQDYCV
ncbi:MAG: hypothetical protein ACREFJ_18880 [Acetobacteraceae bacterium]